MIKIAICDDDITSIETLKQHITTYPNACFKIETFLSGSALLSYEDSFDIIFLDIDMPNINGIETAKQLRKKDKKVLLIYITNYSDYSVFAFAVHAFSYLLKPVSQQQVHQQLKEVFEYRNPFEITSLTFETKEGVIHVKKDEILYFEYLNRKIYMYTKDMCYTLNGKISTLEKELELDGFYSPHKSFLVNMLAIYSIKGNDIYLSNQKTIPLSQKKAAAFKRQLNIYLSNTQRRISPCL